jgi:hypothetical protein
MNDSSRRIALKLLEFCSEELGWDKCASVAPHYKYHKRPQTCTFPNKEKTRNEREECERLGGKYTPSKVVLTEKRSGKKYIRDFDQRCPICLDEYGKYKAPWGCTECDHYMCAICFDILMRYAIEDGKTAFACPLCRGQCTEPEEVIDANKQQPKRSKRGKSGRLT